jgi:hypothetical protein
VAQSPGHGETYRGTNGVGAVAGRHAPTFPLCLSISRSEGCVTYPTSRTVQVPPPPHIQRTAAGPAHLAPVPPGCALVQGCDCLLSRGWCSAPNTVSGSRASRLVLVHGQSTLTHTQAVSGSRARPAASSSGVRRRGPSTPPHTVWRPSSENRCRIPHTQCIICALHGHYI